MTYYVKNRSVVYKQGLNELLPPFVLATAAGIAAKRAEAAGEVAPSGDDMGTQDVRSSSVQRLASDAVIYQCLERTVAKFVPKIYAEDDDFVSLQCSFRLFRLILQYHAPHLCTVLDQYDVPPELYATPWIITLFARMLTAELVLPLWDFLLWHAAGRNTNGTRIPPPTWPQPPDVTWHAAPDAGSTPRSSDPPPNVPQGGLQEDTPGRSHTDSSSSSQDLDAGAPPGGAQPCAPCGPEILHFVAVAFLLSHSAQLLELVRSGGVDVGMDLLGGVSRLAFRDLEHIKQVCIHATQLYHATPASLRDLLFVVCYAPGTKPTTALLARLEERVCAKLTIPELLASSRALDITAALEAARAPPPEAFSGAAAAHDAELEEEAARQKGGEEGPVAPPNDNPFHVPPAPSYFLIDCRPLASFAEGHLPTAFHLDPAALLDPERLQHITSALQELQGGPGGLHFAVLGEGRDDTQYYGSAQDSTFSVFDRRNLQVPPDIAALSSGNAVIDAGEAHTSGTVRRLYLPKAWRKRRGGTDGSSEDPAGTEGTDYSEDDVTKVVVLFLLQRGFKYVSEVQGGHTALVQFQGSALQHLLVESPGLLEASQPRGRTRTGSLSIEARQSSTLASRLVASLFSSPSADTTPPDSRVRAGSRAFGAAAAEGTHSASSYSSTPLAGDTAPAGAQGSASAGPSPPQTAAAFTGAHAAATMGGGAGKTPHNGAGTIASLDNHPLLRQRRGSDASSQTAVSEGTAAGLSGAYAALHRSRQLTHEAPLGGAGVAKTAAHPRQRATSCAAPPHRAAAAPPSLYVPEDAFLEAQVDTLAGESTDTSPYVSRYPALYAWMADVAHAGRSSPLGVAHAPPPSLPPPQPSTAYAPSKGASGSSSATQDADKPSSASSDDGTAPKRGKWGVLSRLRSALEKPTAAAAAAAAALEKSQQAAAATAELYRRNALLGYLMGALPISDLKEHIHAGVLTSVAGRHSGRVQLRDFAVQWSAADENEVDVHQASEGGARTGQVHALGCGAQLKFLPASGTDGSATAPPELYACLHVPDNKVYACLQRAGAHDGDRLSSPALLPLRRFMCVSGDELLMLRPRLCPLFASEALSTDGEVEEAGSLIAGSAREAVVGSAVVQLASHTVSTAAGLSSPSDPPARMLLAVDLRWLDVQERVPLGSITKRFLKSAVPGMMLIRWQGDSGDTQQLAFVLDNLSAFEHTVEAALRRVRAVEGE